MTTDELEAELAHCAEERRHLAVLWVDVMPGMPGGYDERQGESPEIDALVATQRRDIIDAVRLLDAHEAHLRRLLERARAARDRRTALRAFLARHGRPRPS